LAKLVELYIDTDAATVGVDEEDEEEEEAAQFHLPSGCSAVGGTEMCTGANALSRPGL
jgi:hypothetical protein